ncbi:undecaprenyl-diphosphate phosphatase [archaeon]|nr:undecaprenyl-diphosphate phosphatase [archaeon]NCP79626.1 undecaprenyl-diphosphate phosphatase [archaeon]NCP98303.1 undecaprenyl-diphosphate phosphatase [archaeon]NCQ07393.1 undecaprenyl-diphosphate phosphatase [archaeon]NCQ51189.1 undecaprenyl-diphosphate phosphatase [archaeon]
MNEIISYIIIGILQGVVEWLPISSQGNLMVYLSNVLNLSSQLSLNYSILLHIGTLLAAIVYFYKEIKSLLTVKNISLLFKYNFKLLKIKESNLDKDFSYLRFIFITVIVTLLISGPIYFLISDGINNFNILLINLIIGLLLFITGFLIFFSRKIFSKKPVLSIKNSFLLGLFQGFSILPGLSRSGLTTSLLLFRGFSPEKAFRISFLVSIPTIFIGEIALLVFNGLFFSPYILISIVVSFIVGYFTIDLLIKFAKKINFSYFCFILGFIYILTYFI